MARKRQTTRAKATEKEKQAVPAQPARESSSAQDGNSVFTEVLGESILLIMQTRQLNLFGQTFRPIFCGMVSEVADGYITLDPVIIKIPNAPFYQFPTPLSFPMERIAAFTPFDCETRLPLT